MESDRSDQEPKESDRPPPSPNLPPVGEPVLVQCRGFRCLAYLDHEGKWHAASHGHEVRDFVQVVPFS